MFLLHHIILLVSLVFGTITDLKTREVPDWLNFALIGLGLGLGLIESVFAWSYTPILNSLFGLLLGIIIGYIMFYAGQWGGGDSKMIMGLGAIFGLELSTFSLSTLPTFIIYLINTVLLGAFYGFSWIVYVAIKHRKKLTKEIVSLSKQPLFKKLRILALSIALLQIIIAMFLPLVLKILLFVLAVMYLFLLYFWLFTKAVENSCMIKEAKVTELTEGDWIVKDVVVKGKRITGPKDLGITKEQIAQLKKLKVKKVLIKEGVPFVPSFLLAYIATLYLDNWFLLFI